MSSRSAYMLKRSIAILQREFRESVTLKVIATETTDSNDVRAQTYTEYPAYAVVSNLDSEYLQQPFSDLRMGETAFLLDNLRAITDRDRIVHRSIEYVLNRVENVDADGQIIGYVAYGRRLTNP